MTMRCSRSIAIVPFAKQMQLLEQTRQTLSDELHGQIKSDEDPKND